MPRDLIRRPSFIEPFILASKSQNGKLASPSVVCLQRLVAGGAIPRERLRDVLEAFREFSTAGGYPYEPTMLIPLTMERPRPPIEDITVSSGHPTVL